MASVEREIEKLIAATIRTSRDSSGTGALGLFDGVRAFAAAIRWDEPLLLGLFAVQAGFMLLAVVSRRRQMVQMAMLCISLCLVLSASTINHYGRQHWKSLGFSQNYFDRLGVFTSVLLSGPLLASSFFILLHALWRASSMLIKLKRRQLRDRRLEANSGQASASAAAPATTQQREAQSEQDGSVKRRKGAKSR